VRIRVRFSKTGKIRFSSHRDMARCWERALRRAELPVAITEGFSPRPKMHFGLALSTGHESLGEYLDIDLREPEASALDLGALPERLTPFLPPGVDVETVSAIERSELSLQEAVTVCTWRIEIPGVTPEELEVNVQTMLDASTLPVTRERKGKTVSDDIRPGIISLRVVGATATDAPEQGALLEAELATQPRSVRPSELLAAFDPPRNEGRVCRTHQWIITDGARREPIPAHATSRAPAEAGAR